MVTSIGFNASSPCMATPHSCGVWWFMLLPSSGSCGERKHVTLTWYLLLPWQHSILSGFGGGGSERGNPQLKGRDLLFLRKKNFSTLPFHLFNITTPFPSGGNNIQKIQSALINALTLPQHSGLTHQGQTSTVSLRCSVEKASSTSRLNSS